MEKFTEDDLIDELLAVYTPAIRRPGGVTAKEMAEAWGISAMGATRRLNKMVKDGKLTSGIYLCDGRWARVWYRNVQDKEV